MVPVALVAVFIVAASIFVVGFRLQLPYPISPWESGIVTEAWRMRDGLAVYALGSDHATHMYGPLITILLAGVFEISGPTLLAGRLVSVLSGAATVVILAAIFGQGSRLAFILALALLLVANSRSENYFIETRPDMGSALFATLALILLYHGSQSETELSRHWLTVAGTMLLVVAVMFKQTAASLMIVPLLALLAKFDRVLIWKGWKLAAIPIVAVLTALSAIWLFIPGLWRAMVEVPVQYNVSIPRMGRIAIELLASFPLFALVLMHWLLTDLHASMQIPRIRWLISAIVCIVPSSVLACAKSGGTSNSLIPIFLAVGSFCAWRATVVLVMLRDTRRPLSTRIAVGALGSGLLFAQTYPLPGPLTWEALIGGHGTNARALVIAEARSLEGKVVSPDDPTIALIAKRYAGRTAVFEADAVKWDTERMQSLWREIDLSDYVIIMRPGLSANGIATIKTQAGFATPAAALLARGFVQIGFESFSSPNYELWARSHSSEPVE